MEVDLNETLHLNFDELCIDREIMLDEELEQIQEMANDSGISPTLAYKKGIKSVISRNPSFSGFILYRLHKNLDYHIKKR